MIEKLAIHWSKPENMHSKEHTVLHIGTVGNPITFREIFKNGKVVNERIYVKIQINLNN